MISAATAEVNSTDFIRMLPELHYLNLSKCDLVLLFATGATLANL